MTWKSCNRPWSPAQFPKKYGLCETRTKGEEFNSDATILTPDFFCQARRTTSEGGSVHQVHDRLNEEVQRSLMTNRQDSRFARPQAARRVAPRDGCNEKKDNSVLTPDFFCQARRTTSEGGSVHQVHDRLNEEVQRSLKIGRIADLHGEGLAPEGGWRRQAIAELLLGFPLKLFYWFVDPD